MGCVVSGRILETFPKLPHFGESNKAKSEVKKINVCVDGISFHSGCLSVVKVAVNMKKLSIYASIKVVLHNYSIYKIVLIKAKPTELKK